MQQFNQIIRKIPDKANRLAVKKKGSAWWTPVWKGLSADAQGKHRRAMGASLWTYLYLLAYANRKTGVVSRSIKTMAKDMGLSARTLQRHLKLLAAKKYITLLKPQRYAQLRVEKLKLFKPINSDANQSLS